MDEVILSHLLDLAQDERKGLARLLTLYCTAAILLVAGGVYSFFPGKFNIWSINPEVMDYVGISATGFGIGLSFLWSWRKIGKAAKREKQLLEKAKTLITVPRLTALIDPMLFIKTRINRRIIGWASICAWLALVYVFIRG